jgi:outer membrane protein OmpA-like peptidoglycan-associated protein
MLAGVLLLPTIAFAQPIQGLYIGADAGVNFSGTLQQSNSNVNVDTNPGPAGVIALGWGFGNGLRAEIEGSIRSNGVSGIFSRRVNGQLLPLTNTGGNVRSYAAMANIAYDIPLRPYGIQPYVGVGAGYAELDMSDVGGNEPVLFLLPQHNIVVAPAHVSYGSTGAFAYQAFIGAAKPIERVPGLSMTFEYRLFGTASENVPVHFVSTATGDTVNGVLPSAEVHRDFQTLDHAVLIGLRYAFGGAPARAAAPYATPAPAAMPARSFLIFFDWDKSTLTDRARQIVAEAASTSSKVQHTRIEVNGYTDASGTPHYNQDLSLRRARAVAAELVKDGVPQSEIAIHGFGETHPLVPTATEVREPQNRRVEIIIG